MASALTELERSWPNKVALPIPQGGFGWRFAHLLRAARDAGSRRHWQDDGALAFAFYDPGDRTRFEAWLIESQVDWDCPPEWPQIAPPGPSIAPALASSALRFDAVAMEDWVRGAVHRGLARRVVKAYLARYRRDGGHTPALHDAIDALSAERPDLDRAALAECADAIIAWTSRHHRAWFHGKLAAMR